VNKKLKIIFITIIVAFLCVYFWDIYIPKSLLPTSVIMYEAKRGMGDEEISLELEKMGIIKNSIFFRIYAYATGKDKKIQAGTYNLSPKMSVVQILEKFVLGDVVKNKITIIEGFRAKDIANYLESKNFYKKEEFLESVDKGWNEEFTFLESKPKGLNLEGYIFPDTYNVALGTTSEDFLRITLKNFNKKLTTDLRNEIEKQKKSIFQIITMASIIEKEVKTLEDKKNVAGILWKRLEVGMPLQVDATVNYFTGKSDSRVKIVDTKIDSPYNTYKYTGLPLGPISNPGMDSILASIYPTKNDYWYYLSANGNGQTIFSKTLEEHNIAVSKYLK